MVANIHSERFARVKCVDYAKTSGSRRLGEGFALVLVEGKVGGVL